MKPSVTALLVVCILARLSHAGEAGSNSSTSTNEQDTSIDTKDSIHVDLKLTVSREKCLPDAIIPSCVNCGGNDGLKKCLGLKEFDWLYKGCDCIPTIRAIACRFIDNPEWTRPGWVPGKPTRNASTRWHPNGPGRDLGSVQVTQSGTEIGDTDTNANSSNSSSVTKNLPAITSETSETPPESVAKDCPPENQTPSCIDCGGDDGTKKCLGLTESENQWKGCTCDPLAKPLWRDPQGRTMAQLLVIRHTQRWSTLPEAINSTSLDDSIPLTLAEEESVIDYNILEPTSSSSGPVVEVENVIENCPPDDRTPSCINCGGDDGTQRCLGITEQHNLWKGCRCIPHVKDHIHEVDWDEWEAMRQLIINLPLRSPRS